MIRALIIDCFGMLYPDPLAVYRRDGKTPDHIVSALRDIHERGVVGEISRETYVAQASHLLRKTPEKVEAEFFSGEGRDQRAMDYIASLRPARSVVLLTNAAPGMIEARFSIEELERYFDRVEISYLLKAAKPDPAIFRWSCEQLGIQPNEALVVDDSVDNCEAAEAIGMHVVQYRDFERTKREVDAILSAD
jgi:HAD superfamily hydrolase (TIGR01549 family)